MAGDDERLIAYAPRFVTGWAGADEGAFHRRVEGTLAFVDISGFTAMSERLAKFGNVGAEEVTSILGSTFARLLALAYEEGGSLIKFGGDALLVFFSGPCHVERGCRAAVGMRRRLRQIGKIDSSAGKIGLKMSVGVHSGEFDFFVVGELHREIVITGPAASRTVAMESAAVAGEVLVSAETAAQLPDRLLGEEKATGRLLVRQPPPVLVAPAPTAPTQVAPGRFLSQPIREQVLGDAEPEHRLASVAFLRYEGVDALVAEGGPASVAAPLHELIGGIQRIAAAHHVTFLGTDIDANGGKVILVAGVPRSADNDEEQLLRAVRAILDHPRALPLRGGVNRGHVFAGDVGPAYRRTYTIMGDAVNLAARLMARADPDHAYATHAVVERSRTTFRLEALEPFMVKGKADPIEAFDVGPIEGAREAEPASTFPIQGRDRELSIVLDALDAARQGRGSLVELVAEPGLGKSRLLDEVRRSVGERMVAVRGERYASGTPYASIEPMVRELLGLDPSLEGRSAGDALVRTVAEVVPALRPWAPLLALTIDAEVDPTPEVDRLDEANKAEKLHVVLADLVDAMCPDTTLFSVEDLQWVDDASLAALRGLLGGVERRPWCFITARRPEVAGLAQSESAEAHDLVLEPLQREAAQALLRVAGEDLVLAPHDLASLIDRGGGNPLFILELVTAVRAEGGIEGLPESVEAVIGARIDRLEQAPRQLLLVASVLGTGFDGGLLHEIAPKSLPDASADLGEVLDGLVVRDPSGAWRFLQALVRDVAYETLPFRHRKELHRRVGAALEARAGEDLEDVADVLSLHFARGQVAAKAWRYAVMAGDRARDKFATVEASRYYKLAIESGHRLADLSPAELERVSEALGDMCERGGLYDEAARAYGLARRHAGAGAVDQPRLCLKEGTVRLRQGRYSDALRWYRRGLNAGVSLGLRVREEGVHIELGLAYAGARYYQGKYADCIRWCERMVPEALTSGERGGLAHAYSLLHLALVHAGDPRKVAYRGLALPLYEELGDLTRQGHVLNNMGIDSYYEGDWVAAVQLYERGRDALIDAGGVVDAADVTYNIAEILSDQGHLDAADKLTREILQTYRAARYPVGEALAIANLGRTASRAGRFVEAIELLEDALARFRELGDERFAVEVLFRIAELSVFVGAAEEAMARIKELEDAVRRLGDVPALRALLHRLAGYASAQAGNQALALEQLDASVAIAREVGLSYDLALALEALARVLAAAGDDVVAAGPAAEAAELLSGLGVVATPAVPL